MRLKEVMDSQSMSASKLAQKSGLSDSYIRILLADKKSPTLRTLEKLAAVLGVSVADLLDEPQAKAAGE